MARPPPDDDINNSILNATTFTTNPEATPQSPGTNTTPTTPAMPSWFPYHQPTDTDPSADPPPPLPATLDAPSPAEDLALQSWLGRNRAYLTTIPWHRYPSLPVLSYLWGYNDADFRHDCLSSLMFYTRSTGRRLTAEERDALLEPVTRLAVAASYDRPLAAGLGAWLVARSWAKSGAREAFRRAAEGAAATAAAAASAASAASAAGTTGGTLGADGHITHFSTPQHHHHHHHQYQGATGAAGAFGQQARRNVGTLFKRMGRASVPGLLCFAGYQVLWESYRVYLGENEIDSIREDPRLEEMVIQMDRNMASRVGDLEDLLRRRG
ncbi:hypothetical protein VPNG_02609 [Cytospora leucostoma]|uniref:Uncharacterized protein n=1 Tax=Cytospora leucostoma TaxID=1230097 RepID=A0A423XIP2_9PEZI|nr:hypothetical protein VPNG_02609 [Cytospora leucostoma]